MTWYRLAEEFLSINGEGAKAGALAYFLRFPGCNLNCTYCDTAWVNDVGVSTSPRTKEEILSAVKESGAHCVTVTGGEPLLVPEIKELLYYLAKESWMRVEVETNGSVSIEPYTDRPENVCFTLDYKLPGSGMEEFMRTDNYEYLRQQDVIKFVCGSENDLARAKEIIKTYELTKKAQVFLSPVFGNITPEDMVEFMKNNGMPDVRLQLQLHKYIWPPEMRGV